MPKNYYRIDLRLPPTTLKRLRGLLEEAREKTNSNITMNRLLTEIIDSYIAELPVREVEEEKIL